MQIIKRNKLRILKTIMKNFSRKEKTITNSRYFLIPSPIENNLIYLFITPSQTGLHQKHGFS